MLVKHFLLSCELLYAILMGVYWTVVERVAFTPQNAAQWPSGKVAK